MRVVLPQMAYWPEFWELSVSSASSFRLLKALGASKAIIIVKCMKDCLAGVSCEKIIGTTLDQSLWLELSTRSTRILSQITSEFKQLYRRKHTIRSSKKYLNTIGTEIALWDYPKSPNSLRILTKDHQLRKWDMAILLGISKAKLSINSL